MFKMSILFTSEHGWIISHPDYLNKIYINVEDGCCKKSMKFNSNFFEINSQFLRHSQVVNLRKNECTENPEHRKKKRKTVNIAPDILELNHSVKQTAVKILDDAKNLNLFSIANVDHNEKSRAESKTFFLNNLHDNKNFHGGNQNNIAIISEICGNKYIFPKNSEFYCFDIREMKKKLNTSESFDLILMDPPWWNKSIKRKKMKFVESSYEMLGNDELAEIPIKNFLSPQGIVIIWCTNSPSHLKSITEEIFPSWGITLKAKWIWLKITQNGETICDFKDYHGKQPYEQILFGTSSNNDFNIPDKKVIISVPSSVHSHKPPLIEMIKNYLPQNPKCLEIFARYLLPDWTSWGLEVLKFQHLSLFTSVNENEKSQEKT